MHVHFFKVNQNLKVTKYLKHLISLSLTYNSLILKLINLSMINLTSKLLRLTQ